MTDQPKGVRLRAERRDGNSFYLDARLLPDGSLELAGQDLGPITPDGDEYEYFKTFAPDVIPEVLKALGADPGADVLAVLAEWSGEKSWEMERRLGEIEHDLTVI